MATHDYVIANQSGAAFRTDLNNALAAIVSNNSNSSSPATTYAYQWWADTSAGVLKIRNSANNAWIELLQLDGTLTLEDGSASAPALAFRDDLDTGIFSGGANEINIATAGTERFAVDASGNVDIVSGIIHFAGSSSRRVMYRAGDNDMIFEAGANFFYMQDIANSAHKWFTNGADIKFMVQNDGKVGIGVSSVTKLFHVKGDDSAGTQILVQASTGVNSAGIQFDPASGDTFEYQVASTGAFVAYNRTDNRSDIFVDGDGRVLIGGITTNNASGTSAELQVSYTKTTEFGIHIRPSDNNTGGGNPMLFQNQAGTSIGSVSANESNVAFNTSSDYRLKENDVAISDGITRLKELRPIRYNWKVTPEKTVDGFFAHEVISAVPEAVTGEKDAVNEDKSIKPQQLDQSKLIPLLVAAVQELIGKVEKLEAA